MISKKNYIAAEGTLRERYPIDEDKTVIAIVPNYQEDPEVVKHTIERIGEANYHAKRYGLDFRLDEVILSDQSPENVAVVNKGNMCTARDVLKSLYGTETLPEIYHLRFDGVVEEILNDYLSEINNYQHHLKRKLPRGKGWNMFVSSLATGVHQDDSVVMLFIDAENKQISPTYPIALGGRLAQKDSEYKFSKSAFVRYHMEGDKRHLGGRVNASLGAPLLDMMAEKGLMPKLYYPLSGEIGIMRNVWWSIRVPAKYGVEMGTNLQLLSKLSNIQDLPLNEDQYYQVDLGLNMDQPLAEGKPKDVILNKTSEMTGQIMLTTLGLVGNGIKSTWPSPESFLEDFKRRQEVNLKRWTREGTPITGGITVDELRDLTLGKVKDSVERYYSGNLPEDEVEREFLIPVHETRDKIGEIDFEHLVQELTERKKRI